MAGYNHFQLYYYHHQPHLPQPLLSSLMIQLGLFLSIKVSIAEIMPKPYWLLELGLRILILNCGVGGIWLCARVFAAWVIKNIKTFTGFEALRGIVTLLVTVETCDMAQVFGRLMRALARASIRAAIRAWVFLAWWPVWHLIWHLIITPISRKGMGKLSLICGLERLLALWTLGVHFPGSGV